jgi:hypothetical protein
MARCIFPFFNSVSAVRVGHHRELFIMPDQFVRKSLEVLIMDIIIPCSMNKKQVPFKLMGEGNRFRPIYPQQWSQRARHKQKTSKDRENHHNQKKEIPIF